MIKEPIIIINKLGLHARASAKLVNIASQFESTILLKKNDQEISAKSIMSLLLLAASQGTPLEISAEGTDEQAAFLAVKTLINNRFDEES